MITRNSLRCIALTTSCLAPLVAARASHRAHAPAPNRRSRSTAWVRVDGCVRNNPNQAGRYTGLNTSGLES